MILRCKVFRTTTISYSGGRAGKPNHAWWAHVKSTYGTWSYLVPSWNEGMREINRQLRTQHLENLARMCVGGHYQERS